MYLASDSDYLSRAIIEVVSTGQGMRFSTLKKRLETEFEINASKATIYRRISDLVDRNIIIRHGAELLPNLVWVTSIRQLAEKLASKNIGIEEGILELPREEGQSVSYRAGSLAKLDPLWNHIHLELAYRFSQTDWYGYNQHAWYSVGMSESERQLQKTLVQDGQNYHLLYGHDTFLDRLGANNVCTDGFRTALCEPGDFSHELQAFWGAQDYTIECRFSKNILDAFNRFFSTVDSEAAFDANAFDEVFRLKGECIMVVEHNKEKAAKYQDLIRPFFGTTAHHLETQERVAA